MLDIELRQLRYFVTVAEELNFTRAAERLQISQPPLSRQIQQLEKELGVTLLKRTQRRVELTEAGQIFLEECRRILARVEASIVSTQRVAQGKAGRLTIGFEGSRYNRTILLAAQMFRAQFPDVELSFQEMPSGKQVEALSHDRLDLGFIVPNVPTLNLAVEVLTSEPLVAALAQNHPLAAFNPLTLSQLAEENWIVGPEKVGCGLRVQILKACTQAGFTPKISQETNDIQMILGFIAASLGVTLVPTSTGQTSQQSGLVFCALQPPEPTIDLAIAWQLTNSSPALQMFLQIVQDIKSTIAP